MSSKVRLGPSLVAYDNLEGITKIYKLYGDFDEIVKNSDIIELNLT